MIDSKDILTLLSIPSDNIEDVSIISDTKEITFIDIELKDIRTHCPFCFSTNIGIKDYYTKRINNSIIRRQKLFVNVRMRRFICKKCKKTFIQHFSLSEENDRISHKVKESVQYMLLDRVSMEYIGKELNISKQTVINILDEMPNPTRLNLPSVLCIDEFHFSNSNSKAGKYPCVLSNPFNSDIIDIIESRHKEYLFEYFQNISISERNRVKYFISDMNESYRTVHKCFFSNSVYIVDHFHVVKLFTEAIQVIRTRIMKNEEKDSKAYKFLKKNWKLFLMNRFNLKDKTFIDRKTGIVYTTLDSIDYVLKNYPALYEVYWAKDDFVSKMIKLNDYDETKKYLDFFIYKYSKSTLVELNKISSTFKNWYEEIINAYSKNTYGIVLSNAVAESNNNYIQTLINIGYGYSNFSRLRKRILYISSNRKG